MMLDTFDGKIWYPRFYDMDTICSYNNSGEIKYDVDIEMAQGYWNTSASRLWTKIRDNFHDELVAMYAKMRANGLSYESLMSYFYGQQISKIPETYYNKDADTKYLPFADQYMGMAHGNGYEHLKRWLKNRLIFTDTLFDYAPSYNNDVLTIRANTTEPMTITIETYTPVYQHLSWYNNQMDKKKIDGKTAITFTGTAQTATDQEVLIYGGSNIKRITGISSMNPNSMLIGSATRLIELDISNCPILATVNATGSNFTPHTYLNKLDISNCPKLTGTLRINNSPLLRELNAKGTGIDTLQLAPSLRNLEVLRLPNTVTELILNDAGLLNTLEFDEGANLQRISLSNCPGITNSSIDLTKVPTVSLDNSLDKEEIYLSEVTDLTLKNMPTLKRLLFTPNNEYEEFDINNVISGKNYKVTTFNNPNMKEFITTAPHRLSYNNGEYGDIYPNTTFSANTLDLSDTQFTDIKLLCTTDLYNLKVPTTMKNFYCDSAMDIDTEVVTDASYEVIHDELVEQYTTNYESNVYKYKNITETMVWNDGNFNTIYPSISHGDNYSDKIYVKEGSTYTINANNSTWLKAFGFDSSDTVIWQYGGNSTSDTTALSGTIPNGVIYIRFARVGGDNVTITYLKAVTPNVIPSSASGSLIFNLYSNNTTQPTSTSPYMWDLTGLKLNDFYTFGMNNWVKPSDNLVRLYDDILPRRDGRIYNCGDIGSTLTCSIAMGGGYSLPPIKVKEGDVISHVCKDGYSTKWRYACTDDNNIIISGTNNYNDDNATAIVPAGATKLWIVITTIHTAHNGDYLISEINGVQVTVDKKAQHSTNLSESEILTITPIILDGSYILTDTPTSITMPQRLPGYSIRMVNADITPNNYANHLYPLLVDTTLPITGKLDYSKYKGSSLAWAYAYTTNDVAITPLDSRHIGGITNEYNKLYGTDYVDIVDVWAYKDDDFSNKTTNEAITKAYIELTQDNYTTRIDEVLQWYPNCTELYLFDDGSVTDLQYIYSNGGHNNANGTRPQVQNITFMEGYFNNLKILSNAFTSCINLVTVNNIPKSVTDFKNCFEDCNKLNCQFDLSDYNIRDGRLDGAFFNNYELSYTPILPSNYTGSMNNSFKQCRKLVEAPTIPNGVTSMNNAFDGCSVLTTAPTIPNGVTSMNGTFNTCSALTTVPNIPDSVINLGWAFQHCSSLTTVPTIPNSVTIMNNTFNGCSSLTTVPNIPDSVTNMNSTFQGCSALTTAPTIPEGVTNMNSTFNGCSSLTTVPNIPNSVTNMNSTFNGCSSLTTVPNIPSGVETMDSTFRSCEKLKNIAVNGNLDNLTKINSLYRRCLAIETVYIPLKSVVNTFDNVLTDTTALRDVVWLGERSSDFNVTALNGNIPQSDIKELVNEHLGTVESATLTLGETYGAYLSPDEVFLANRKGWTIEGVSNDFTIVNASDDVSGLTRDENITGCVIELTSTNYTTRIDEVLQWYPNCTDLYLFDDGSVTSLMHLFNYYNNASRTQIQNVTFIENYFTNLTDIRYIFYGCSKLKTVNNLPNNIQNFTYAFTNCSSLNCLFDFSSFNIARDMFQSVFNSCSSLTYPPILPSNYTGSMNGCFQGCKALTTAPTIPNGVTNMTNTFYGCSNLTTVPNISNSVTNMQSTFYGCSSLTTVPNIPNSVTNMNQTFYGCLSLTIAPNIPDSVTDIFGTFCNCSSLTECTIPLTNVTNYTNCLQNCSALTNITWIGERTTVFSLVLLGAPSYTQADIQELVPEHLGTVESATLTLGATNLAYLTEEEIASAVAKGWTLQ